MTPLIVKKKLTENASNVFIRLAEFRQTKRLQVELLLMLVKFIDKSDLRENAEAFQLIDTDRTGSITALECIDKVKQINESDAFDFRINENDVHQFIRKVDLDMTGKISYSQFLCATLTGNHFSKENMTNLFKDFDSLNAGYLTKESLLKTFKRNVRNIKMDDVIEMM